MRNIFDYAHYSKYLRDLIRDKDSSWTVSELAQAAGVQRPYMSNVLAQRSQLSLEQAFRLTRALHFNENEQSYFLNMVEIERASSSEYKVHLQEKNEALRKDASKLENKLQRTPVRLDPQMTAEYFSTWEYVAIHVLVSIHEYQTIAKISEALHLPQEQAIKYLGKLVEWHLVQKSGNHFKWASGDIHLPAKSSLVHLHHRNWRERSTEHARRFPEEGVHFTSAYSMSNKDYEKFKGLILNFLKQYNHDAAISKEEALVCFNVDLFSLT